MTTDHDDLSRFQDAYLDYLEDARAEAPALDDLPEEQRRPAEAFIRSITAARGIDPQASRPSIEQLLRSRTCDSASELGEALQHHLRLTVDSGALVKPDAASAAVGLASTLVIQARGMRMRVVEEANSQNLDNALTNRAEDIAKVFSAFPDSHAVLYTTAARGTHGVVLDRSDVHRAIETPLGERRAPRLRRSIATAPTACEVWLKGIVPDFQPLSSDLLGPTSAPELALDHLQLANKVVSEVSLAGERARVEAKRTTWRRFGDVEAQRLAAIVQEAQRGDFSKEIYESHLDEMVGRAA